MMAEATPNYHVVAMPYPGRGHINPMLNLCHLILNSRPDIVISFIVTEEWLGLVATSPPPPSANFNFRTIPNVIPSEIGRGKDFPAFFKATRTKLEAPVEQLLDRLPPPNPAVIIYDTYLTWVVELGHRKNIPVASFYTMSATVFSIFYHSDLIHQSHDFSYNVSDEEGKEQLLKCIPGVSSMRVRDLPTPFHGGGKEIFPYALEAVHASSKAQYLLFASVYELESRVIDALRQTLPLKIYSLGLTIPSINLGNLTPAVEEKPYYLQWLDAQPKDSVLYISHGSFRSVSNAQLDEIIAGVRASGVRFLWVARGEDDRLRENCGAKGLAVTWCDQLKVLCHPSIGGFWSHCGWNSTKEGAFACLPMLTFPIFWDQVTNSKMIVEDWKTGLRVKKDDGSLVTRDEIAKLVLRLMDSESEEAMARRRRAKEIQEICKNASSKGGSSDIDIQAFIRDILGC